MIILSLYPQFTTYRYLCKESNFYFRKLLYLTVYTHVQINEYNILCKYLQNLNYQYIIQTHRKFDLGPCQFL